MLKQSLTCLCLYLPGLSMACPALDGEWKSSKEKFIEFNQKRANVDEKPWAFMQQTQGYETIIYSLKEKQIAISNPAIPFKLGKIDTTLPAAEKQMSFEVLACTEDSVAIKYQQQGKEKIEQLHFEDKDTYWVYMGNAGSDGNSHIREYYTRKK